MIELIIATSLAIGFIAGIAVLALIQEPKE